MRVVRSLGTAVAAAALAACVSRPAPPAPVPAPVVRPVPAPPAPAPAPVLDWQDALLSPGDWTYRGEPGDRIAEFRSGGMSFSLSCERDNMIMVALSGAQPATVTIRTSYGERRLPATSGRLAASDTLFDQIAFSRGRILVQGEGSPDLIVPAWPEPARLVEDCRQ